MTDNYVKFISEQVHKEKVRGFTNIAITESSENYTHELDANDGHKMVADLKKKGFHAKIHKAVGPAGGAAVVHLGHPSGEKHVHSWIKKNYDEDHSKSDDMYKI